MPSPDAFNCGTNGQFCISCQAGMTCNAGICGASQNMMSGGNCQSGDLKLAEMTTANATSVVSMGQLQASASVQFAGQAAFETPTVGVCVPNDAVSLVVSPGVGMNSVVSWHLAGALGQKVDRSTATSWLTWSSPGVMVPKSPTLTVSPGHHELRFATTAQNGVINPSLGVRRGTRATMSKITINVVFVAGSGLSQNDVTTLFEGSAVFDQVLSQAGIEVTQVGAGSINDGSLTVINDSELTRLSQATIESLADAPMVDGAVNLYFLQEVRSADAAGTLLGQAMSVPGMPKAPAREGVVLSVDAHRAGGVIQSTAVWTTLAHELAHWLGLRHTSERTGTIHDLIDDTPQCLASRDTNRDGLIAENECLGFGSDNLMFWTYDFSNPHTQVTAGQAFVLSSALTVEPK